MEVSLAVLEELYNRVKLKFQEEIQSRGINVPTSETSFWNIVHDGRPLFGSLVGNIEPLFLRDKFKYKKDRRYNVLEQQVLNISDDEYLRLLLVFLGFAGDTAGEAFNSFLETIDSAQKQFQIDHLNKVNNVVTRNRKPHDAKDEIIEASAKLLSVLYTPRLCSEPFWFFFYGYDKLKGVRSEKINTWPLVKLLIKFINIDENDIRVEITNTNDPEFHDYLGRTDFATSVEGVLVINCRTYPEYTRQLNIKLNIGRGTGDIFLGQYMNYEEGRIISGSVILQRIRSDDRTPSVHRVPILSPNEKMYKEDFEGVDKSILQYLHSKKINFRRTSLRAGHSLDTLERWLKHHHGPASSE